MNSDVRDADLSSVYLHKFVLAITDLAGTDLYKAHLNEAYLNNSKFTYASPADTTLGALHLSSAVDLEKTHHHGPSTCLTMVFRSV